MVITLIHSFGSDCAASGCIVSSLLATLRKRSCESGANLRGLYTVHATDHHRIYRTCCGRNCLLLETDGKMAASSNGISRYWHHCHWKTDAVECAGDLQWRIYCSAGVCVRTVTLKKNQTGKLRDMLRPDTDVRPRGVRHFA